MKLHIERVLENFDGEPLMFGEGKEQAPSMLGPICVTALITDHNDDANAPGEKKYHRWSLAKRIDKAMKVEPVAAIDLPVEDIDLIKKRISKIYQTRVVGPAYVALEDQSD